MNMKKWIAAAIACSALTLGACSGQSKDTTAAAPAAADPNKVYRVAMNAEFAPFESRDANGKVEGFDVDLMDAMAKAGNFKVEYKHQPWESLFPALNNGDVDIVMSGVTITDDRKQSMDFTDPYFEITQVVLVPQGKPISSSEDLKNLNKVGVVTGYTGDFSVSKLLGNDSPKIARFETVPLVIKELENGGLDAVVSDSAVIANYVKNNPTKGMDFITLPDFTVENYGIAARKGDEATVQMLNDALKKVRESGEYEQIKAKYFADEAKK
ncbi:basic amino acid ABC transporter substrate-binding protein [Neisseria sp. N95_16]|uniref:Transporter substrate-binding domain-containing protein n=1 Tax=Neisseria brasiliensis TaxID=2666100 RepID=A0A5Q3S2J7_9NEIS|nr:MULTISPECIES: basic amino acid ABC transporter substrate-binding protein [Neisseria]MRN38709.1 transporter substrate-binding domain-containing protein [Neisseria brasiliensis]PJO10369.1 basic amino acid ABC transporter substrate-binding protein [Neisseria sp. N95_16]PJO78896.1 basic amino acid ABC transporter substrate-binding protein [Neisseria sp. N177_16]QGL25613.1 transporter substrate-binding domain-containing protein [Neisseria brasiliensis]